MTEQKPIRVAVYCRKSVMDEDARAMEFNSLDAQREAAEAYITSQKASGWVCLPQHYDDAGFSGGNVKRPALERLLEDIRAGKVDVVIVYKIDRLSRSLMDFVALLKLFERHRVTFTSVTQEINTSTSAGRMMLNILITFAAFEREQNIERIKDKVSASKRKGMFCGGPPPLGYRSDPVTKKLHVVSEEAELVRRIFASYLRLASARDVAAELTAEGLRTRVFVSRSGRTHGGTPYTGPYIYHVLSNPIYLGLVRHYDKTYPGEHEAILDRETWAATQKLLAEQCRYDGKRAKRLTPLRGLIRCGVCGGAMKETFTSKTKIMRYRYFICEKDTKRVRSACPVKRIPAAELEKLLLANVSQMLSTPEMTAGILNAAKDLDENGKFLKVQQIRQAFRNLNDVWDVMFPAERYRLIHEIIKEIMIYPDKVRIEYRAQGLEQLIREAETAGVPAEVDCELPAKTEEEVVVEESGDNGMRSTERLVNGNFVVTIPIRLKHDGHKTVIVQPGNVPVALDPEALTPMQNALVQGFRYRDVLEQGETMTVTELAKQENMDRPYLFRSLSTVNLAPDIVEMILNGTEPKTLTMGQLRKGFPDDWEEQRKLFGIQ